MWRRIKAIKTSIPPSEKTFSKPRHPMPLKVASDQVTTLGFSTKKKQNPSPHFVAMFKV
jgi:hypothetical protein